MRQQGADALVGTVIGEQDVQLRGKVFVVSAPAILEAVEPDPDPNPFTMTGIG